MSFGNVALKYYDDRNLKKTQICLECYGNCDLKKTTIAFK